MSKLASIARTFWDQVLPWLVLLILLFYTYMYVGVAPYWGFAIDNTGRVAYSIDPDVLPLDTQLLKIGLTPVAEHSKTKQDFVFAYLRPGDIVPLTFLNNGQTTTLLWQIRGFTWEEFFDRLIFSQSLWGYPLWGLGLFIAWHMRPHYTSQRLLMAFNFLVAGMLVASMAARWRLAEAIFWLLVCRWLLWPVSWHFHWSFPKPLRPLPRWCWWGLYLLAAFGVIAERFWFLAFNIGLLAFMAAFVGSALMVLVRLVWFSDQRRDIRLIFFAAGLGLVGTVIVGVVFFLAPHLINNWLSGWVFLTVFLLPFAYVYTVYRRRLGGLELRANRWITIGLFGLTLAFVVGLALTLLALLGGPTTLSIEASVGLGLGMMVITHFTFPHFQNAVERWVLGIPPASQHLLATYTPRISQALTPTELLAILHQHLFPELLIRQSAIVLRTSDSAWTVLLAEGLTETDLPPAAEITDLLAHAGRYRDLTQPRWPWVRVILPLPVGASVLGVWLLGRRDPDDFYTPIEIAHLQALAAHVAIVLAHNQQVEYLRQLYQVNITRQENERKALARDLHDTVLNELGGLGNYVDNADARVHTILRRANTHLRDLITGLRPATLNYGLRLALVGLGDELGERASPSSFTVQVDIPPSTARYGDEVEGHIFRIVQQACHNARRHAQAHTLRLYGCLEPNRIDLTVEDDGQGFEVDTPVALTRLLEQQRFGLAGIFERAHLIDAHLQLESAPGQGTRVQVIWPAAHAQKLTINHSQEHPPENTAFH